MSIGDLEKDSEYQISFASSTLTLFKQKRTSTSVILHVSLLYIHLLGYTGSSAAFFSIQILLSSPQNVIQVSNLNILAQFLSSEWA